MTHGIPDAADSSNREAVADGRDFDRPHKQPNEGDTCTLRTLTPEQRTMYLPKEVPATLQIYLDGKMEQFWLRDKEAGVIFLMTVDSVEEADTILKALPLGRANLLTFELMPVGPPHSSRTGRTAKRLDSAGEFAGAARGALQPAQYPDRSRAARTALRTRVRKAPSTIA
jgi:hypothetical protein